MPGTSVPGFLLKYQPLWRVDKAGKAIGYQIKLTNEAPQPFPGKDHNCWEYPEPYEFTANAQRGFQYYFLLSHERQRWCGIRLIIAPRHNFHGRVGASAAFGYSTCLDTGMSFITLLL